MTTEPLCEESLNSDGTKKVLVGSLQTEEERAQLLRFLANNQDMFAWSHMDMSGIDPCVACHKLNTDPEFPPYRNDKEVHPTKKSNHQRRDRPGPRGRIYSRSLVSFSDF